MRRATSGWCPSTLSDDENVKPQERIPTRNPGVMGHPTFSGHSVRANASIPRIAMRLTARHVPCASWIKLCSFKRATDSPFQPADQIPTCPGKWQP